MTSSLEQKLELIKDVKRFCIEELGVAENNSYTKLYNPKAKPNETEYTARYNLYVSPKNRIKSLLDTRQNRVMTALLQIYDIDNGELYGNNIKYKSFDECLLASTIYNLAQYDTFIREIAAFAGGNKKTAGDSTQITKELLDSGTIGLTKTVIHENFHIHKRKNGLKDFDRSIEEAVASQFGYHGALLYHKNDATMIKKIHGNNERMGQFYAWYNNSIKRLNKAYSEDHIKGRRLLYRIRNNYDENNIKIDWDVADTIIFNKKHINNAFFLSAAYYSKHHESVEKILKNKDPRAYLQQIIGSKEIYTLKQLREAVNK